MAREARKLKAFAIYAVHQTASDGRILFENDDDRERFLLILKQTKLRYGYHLFSYCIKEDHAYDLLIGSNGNDLSKIMKSINIAYALYANAGGKLFRDRYKSSALENDEAIVATAQYFQGQKSGAEERKSLKTRREKIDLLDIYVPNHLRDEQACTTCIKSLEEAKEVLADIMGRREDDLETLVYDKANRDKLILKFRRESTLSLKELGILFGGLSESTICKILGNQCQ